MNLIKISVHFACVIFVANHILQGSYFVPFHGCKSAEVFAYQVCVRGIMKILFLKD